jgi:hypothetical protein
MSRDYPPILPILFASIYNSDLNGGVIGFLG